MSKFSAFMKSNKTAKKNEFYPVTKSLCDENGNPLEWEFRHITSKENEQIRNDSTREVPVFGKPNMYRQKVDGGKFALAMVVKSVVYPDLYDADLQDSYGVNTPEDLLLEMVDDPGEYTKLIAYVQKLQGYDVSFDEKVEEAKN